MTIAIEATMEGVEPSVATSSPTTALPPGRGRVVVAPGPRGRTVVTQAYATSPLRLLTPRNHGHAAWVFMSTYGGGLVGGDCVAVDVHVDRDASLYLSTQASTKVYRSSLGTRSDLHVQVEKGATLVLAPDPVVPFQGSTYRQAQSIDLDADASVVIVDWMSSGRLAAGERWAFDHCSSRLDVRIDGAPVLKDATALRACDGDLRRRMGRFNVLATVVLVGTPLAAEARALSSRLAGLPVERHAVQITTAPLGDQGCLVRIAGVFIERTAQAIRDCLRFVPALLGDDPWARKW